MLTDIVMMMLQCSAGHFTTNSSIVSCQKFDCILYYSTNFASVYLYPSCAVSTLRTSTRAIVEPLILCAWLIGYLRKNKSSHMNEKIIRLQVVQEAFHILPQQQESPRR